MGGILATYEHTPQKWLLCNKCLRPQLTWRNLSPWRQSIGSSNVWHTRMTATPIVQFWDTQRQPSDSTIWGVCTFPNQHVRVLILMGRASATGFPPEHGSRWLLLGRIHMPHFFPFQETSHSALQTQSLVFLVGSPFIRPDMFLPIINSECCLDACSFSCHHRPGFNLVHFLPSVIRALKMLAVGIKHYEVVWKNKGESQCL